MKEQIVTLTCGISSSGKSSWTIEEVKNEGVLRINRDDIRRTIVGDLKGYYQRKDIENLEKYVTDIETMMFHEIVSFTTSSIIIDNTHLKQRYIKRWQEVCKGLTDATGKNIRLGIKWFDIDLETAKSRVWKRDLEMLNRDWSKLEYIERQYSQYQELKKFYEQQEKAAI